jgi:hypothetical protein
MNLDIDFLLPITAADLAKVAAFGVLLTAVLGSACWS